MGKKWKLCEVNCTTYSLYLIQYSFPNGWMFYLYICQIIYNIGEKTKLIEDKWQLYSKKLLKALWIGWKTDQTCFFKHSLCLKPCLLSNIWN